MSSKAALRCNVVPADAGLLERSQDGQVDELRAIVAEDGFGSTLADHDRWEFPHDLADGHGRVGLRPLPARECRERMPSGRGQQETARCCNESSG